MDGLPANYLLLRQRMAWNTSIRKCICHSGMKNTKQNGGKLYRKLQSYQVYSSVCKMTGSSCRTTLKGLFSRLPNLETIHYKPWRRWSPNDETDQGNCLILELLFLNENLKKLILFENFDEQYSSLFSGSGDAQTTSLQTSNPSVVREVAKTSLKLHHLSASFIIEADHFFDAAETEPVRNWPHLRSR
ncbi:hypothetical protein F5Y04DRAFT_291411 [Hypomontagnella monticulosa]|nr:hypothetical protein F5Y04DRAFT_291411 [Hypomontagnella monticulosa]